MSEPQGRTLVQLHDWAVMIQKAWQVHNERPSRPPYRGPQKGLDGLHRARIPFCSEVATINGDSADVLSLI